MKNSKSVIIIDFFTAISKITYANYMYSTTVNTAIKLLDTIASTVRNICTVRSILQTKTCEPTNPTYLSKSGCMNTIPKRKKHIWKASLKTTIAIQTKLYQRTINHLTIIYLFPNTEVLIKTLLYDRHCVYKETY